MKQKRDKPQRHKELEASVLLCGSLCSLCLCGEKKRRKEEPCPELDSRSGSALILVLAVVVVLAVVIADFAADMKSELKAAGGYYESAMNFQLARSALALARLELKAKGTKLYANGKGDAYFVAGSEDYESAIEDLRVYRDGYDLGRGRLAYRIVYSSASLDPNELGQNDWHRLLEVACDMDEGEERSALVDAIIDWIDADNLTRANGAEEAFYQTLDPPRHVKNAALDSPEELLLVYGMTPELFYGDGLPVREEDGMIRGGGLLRYFSGDNSPEGRASAQYVLRGTLPAQKDRDEEDELEYKPVETLPKQLYLIAQGFVPEGTTDEESDPFYEKPEEPAYLSRHIMLVRLVLGEGNNAGYEMGDLLENAASETVERVMAYGISEEGGG